MGNGISTLNTILETHYPQLTAKGKRLADFVSLKPNKAVFMTTRQLAAAAAVSEATVVRFVRQLGFRSYPLFINALKELMDTKLTLIERNRITSHDVYSEDRHLDRITHQDIQDIKAMTKAIDLSVTRTIRKLLKRAEAVHIIGSRLSYTAAYYMGWIMAKIRKDVFIYKGSDRTTLDRLIFAPEQSVVVIMATSRYPNELIRIGKLVKRQNLVLILLTDSPSCPLVQFSDHVLFAPSKTIPFLGSPTSLISLINYLVHSMAREMGKGMKNHQEKLEQAYLENDILFDCQSPPISL